MNTNDIKPVIVSRKRAADLLCMKPATLRAWAALTPPKGPPFVKMGGNKQSRTYYRLSDIERFAANPQEFSG
jgi:hypothetical protein